MTASDVKAAVLHRRLTEAMDTETADALIERLPPDWEQLATKSDLAQLGTELRGEMGELRGEMATLGADLGGKITDLAAEMKAMESRIDRRAARDLRTVVFTFAGFALAVVGMFVTILVAGVPSAG